MRRPLIALALAAAACGSKATKVTATGDTTGTTPTTTAPAGFDWGRYPRVDITDYYGLVSSSYAPLRGVPGIQKTLKDAGVPEGEVEGVLAGAEEAVWPPPFTENQRWNGTNNQEIALVRSRHVAYLPNEQVLLIALAAENQHLKPDARPAKDFFLIFMGESVKAIDPLPERRRAIETGVSGEFAYATIVDPGQLVSTPGLRTIPGVSDLLLAAGIPASEHENVFTRVEETGWPYYFSDFQTRIKNPETIKLYVVRRVTVVSGMVLVIIPAAENQHMPDGWQPDVDIYATFLESGLQ